MSGKDCELIGEIESIVVTLEDGRWQRFSREDIAVVRDFAAISLGISAPADSRLWKLLAFITRLSPPLEIMPTPERIAGEGE